MKMNSAGQVILKETDAIEALYQDKKIDNIVVEEDKWINQYNRLVELFDFPESRINYEVASKLNSSEFVDECVGIDGWNIPEEYRDIDVVRWLNNRELTHEQRERLHLEIELFRERNMIPVLTFLLYFIDTLKKNGIVWGVGRGSSVASYVLFLIGVHKIDSIKYDLDIKEFLK